jgi:hypothetical protein
MGGDTVGGGDNAYLLCNTGDDMEDNSIESVLLACVGADA